MLHAMQTQHATPTRHGEGKSLQKYVPRPKIYGSGAQQCNKLRATWDSRGASAQRMKRLRDENPPETHKKRRTEALEVPSDLQDMEIPLEDMGDVIVLTGL